MGAAASVINWNQKEVMTVDTPGPGWRKVKTFSRAIFKKYEWETLKVFCQKYKIAQKDLVRVFQTFLAGDEAYIREFRVRALDARNKFGKYSKLFQELADIFIPSMYLRNFTGLQAIESGEELSFARFVINSYIFGCQHFPDLIYDFFAVLRQKLNIQLSIVISPFSVSKIVDILTEEFPEQGTLRTLKQGMKRLEDGADMRLFSIINMGVKYPLMFYAVERFRKLYKRIIFGDKFWADRKFLKLRHVAMESYLDEDLDSCFTTVAAATKRTALSIIADSLMQALTDKKSWLPNDVFRITPTILNSAQVTQLKSVLGYKSARAVLLDSEIPLDFNATFLQSHKLTAPVQSPPSKNLPVSPWNDSEDNLTNSDYYASHPSSPNRPPSQPEQLRQQQQPSAPFLSPSHQHSEFPLLGYDIEEHVHYNHNNHNNHSTTQSSHPHHHHHGHHHGHHPGHHPHHIDSQSQEPSPPHPAISSSEADDYLQSHLFPRDIRSADSAAANSHELEVEEMERDGVLMIHDNQFDRDFRFDVHTGRSRWQQLFIDTDGQVVREVFY